MKYDKDVLLQLPSCELVKLLNEAYEQNDENLINIYSYALAHRMYLMSKNESFKDVLKDLGYSTQILKLKKED